MKLLSFGDILFDVFPDGELLGGAPLNLAAHAAAQGADAYVVSALGNDALGTRALEEIKALGVNTDYVASLDDKETGKCLVTLNESGVPSYNLLEDVAYDYVPLPDFKENFDILCFGTLPLRSENNLKTLKGIIDKGICKRIYCDLNIRPPFSTEKAALFCLENADIVKISDEELPFVTNAAFGKELSVDDALREIHIKYPKIKIILITLGAHGSVALDALNNRIYRQPAYPCEVVSTVGAGDSFGATFITNYFAGKSIDKCLRLASFVSAYVVSQKGAVPDGIKELLKMI